MRRALHAGEASERRAGTKTSEVEAAAKSVYFTLFPCGFDVTVDEVTDRKRLIHVADTVILHCESIESYEKVIPFIVGPYRRLIINGNVTYQQVERLVTCAANVKQVLINARIHFEPGEHIIFVNLVMQFCRGPLYRFSYDPKCNTNQLYLCLKEAYKDNKVCAVFGPEERDRVDVQYLCSLKRVAQDDRFQFEMHLQVNEPDAKIQEKIDALLSSNFKISPINRLPYHEREPDTITRYLRFYYCNQRPRYELIKKEQPFVINLNCATA
uniref:Recep_L_domain domain-containing protein n=1 Tax=Panagrellus redivivus TaxID=6233 RepID=A0A7E5A1R4_PANRE